MINIQGNMGLAALVAGMMLLSGQRAWAEDRYTVDAERSRISFVGDSTLHQFHGEAASFEGEWTVNDQGDGPVTMSGEIIVPVMAMSTKNRRRDGNMYRMFQSGLFPKITCRVSQIRPLPEDGKKAHAVGTLRIRDIERAFETDLEMVKADGGFQLKGDMRVSLADFNLKPPSFLGIIRVADPVDVHFEIELEKKP